MLWALVLSTKALPPYDCAYTPTACASFEFAADACSSKLTQGASFMRCVAGELHRGHHIDLPHDLELSLRRNEMEEGVEDYVKQMRERQQVDMFMVSCTTLFATSVSFMFRSC